MRIPLQFEMESRDGTLAKDQKLVNVYQSRELGRLMTRTRPGISTVVTSLSGAGQGLSGNHTSYIFVATSFATLTSTLTLSTIGTIANPNDKVVDIQEIP